MLKNSDFPRNPDWSHPGLRDFEGAALFRDVSFDFVIDHVPRGLVYLATPYSKLAVDADGKWDVLRSHDAQARASLWAARFTEVGVTAIPPISLAADMVHFEASHRSPASRLDPLDGRFWAGWCAPLLAASRAVIVPPILGWDESMGIWEEVTISLGRSRPVFVLEQGA